MAAPQCKAMRSDVTFLLTNRCGNRCRHCIAGSGSELPDEMPVEDLIRGFETIRSCFGVSRIAFSGGDPLLHHDFAYLYEVAAQQFDITLFSTGVGLTSECRALFGQAPPTRVICSLYGLPSTHDSFCGKDGAFADVVTALEFFGEIGTRTTVNLVCHRGNLNEIKQVIVDLQSRGQADEFKVLAFSPLGRGQALGSFLVRNSEWIGFMDDLREHFLQTDNNLGQRIEVERHVRRIDHNDTCKPNCCAVSIDRNGVFSSCIHIDANGDMFPCVMLLRNPIFRFGNIRSIDTIDLRSYYERVSIEVSTIKKRHCAQCSAANDCMGGCLGYHLMTGRDHRCEDFTFDLGCPTRYEFLL